MFKGAFREQYRQQQLQELQQLSEPRLDQIMQTRGLPVLPMQTVESKINSVMKLEFSIDGLERAQADAVARQNRKKRPVRAGCETLTKMESQGDKCEKLARVHDPLKELWCARQKRTTPKR